ncbi:unnamed protein product [Calypogeia fissa]
MELSGEKKIGGKETRRIESLGWIIEFSVMPRKRRDIEGVGAASILELQAERYRTQEDVKKIKEGGAVHLDEQSQEQKQLIKEVNEVTIHERQKAWTLKQKGETAAARLHYGPAMGDV